MKHNSGHFWSQTSNRPKSLLLQRVLSGCHLMSSLTQSRYLWLMSLYACKNGGIGKWHCPVCQCLLTLSTSGTTISAKSELSLKLHFQSKRNEKVSRQGNCHLFQTNCQFVLGDRVCIPVPLRVIVWYCVRSNGRTLSLSDRRPIRLESCFELAVAVVSHCRMHFFGRFCKLFAESEQSILW